MRIDAHQHFWQYNPARDTWIDDSMTFLRKDFLPRDLKDHLEHNKLDGCIAVQADQSEEETRFLLNLADQNPMIKGVVGWVDLTDPNVKDKLAGFAKNSVFKGVRHILQSESDPEYMMREDFLRGIEALSSLGLTYDILILPEHLTTALKLIRQFPEQRFVLDHLAKPAIKDQLISPWKEEIEALAAYPNLYCKLSGLITEADWHKWYPKDIFPYLDVAFDAFGTDRLMYGSDWPVCLLAGQYSTTYELVFSYMSDYPKTCKEKVMGMNACKFYNLK